MHAPISFSAACFFIVALVAGATSASAAGNADAGKKKAHMCATCHGLDGKSKLPGAPNLAGQELVYLTKALHDFKSGARKNENMSVVIGSLSPEDIEDLAAYYSSIHVTVEPAK